jgi:hypothetical protein
MGAGVEQDIDMANTELNVTAAYNILAIANIEDAGERYLNNMSPIEWVLQWNGKSEKDVIAAARAWTSTGPAIAPTGLLMSGRAEKPANTFRVTIPLLRNQIRFDVVNNTGDELVSVSLHNVYPYSKIWNDGSTAGTPDFGDATSRIRDYYGYANADLQNILNMDDEVRGHFYAFENQVPMPVQNDNLTTCLIVGLNNSATGTTYYRVNIAPANSPQMLKRNHSYTLTLNSAGSKGQATVDAAYDYPNNNQLDYVINSWDITEAGIIMQDGTSLLSSPYKTVHFNLEGYITGSDPNQASGSRSFNLITFTSSPTHVSGIEIIDQEYHLNGTAAEYTGIEAKLRVGSDGNNTNTLEFIRIDQRVPGDKVEGWIKIGYAGLRMTINVLQTDIVKETLNVFLPDGGIPPFAPFGGIESGTIRVEASDSWTARILSQDNAFGFVGTTALQISRTLEESKEFAIRTVSDNPGELRNAVLLIRLDKDPENYARVIQLTQQERANIAIVPGQNVTFNGTYDAAKPGDLDGELASIPNNTVYKFIVRPGEVMGITDPIGQNEWFYRIEVDGDVIYDEQIGTVNDADRNWFKVTANHNTALDDLETTADDNTVLVDVTGKNTSGSVRKAKLVVYLKNSSANSSIEIFQQSLGITFSPNTVPAIAKTGGESQLIGIQGDASLKWELRSFATEGTGGHFALKHHEAELLLDNGDPVVLGAAYGVPNQKFKVRFPKILYPNREIKISAVVTIGIVGSELEQTIRIDQTPLTPAPMVSWGLSGSPNYGGLGDTYNRGWEGGSNAGNYGLKYIPGYKALGVSAVSSTTTINPTVNYLHVIPHISGSNGRNYSWAAVNEYMKRDALTVIITQDNNGVHSDGQGPMNNAGSPLKKAGYPNTRYGSDYNAGIYQGHTDHRIYQFVFQHGHTTLAPSDITGYFYVDGINTWIPGPWPETATVLMAKHTSGSDSSPISENAILIVDVKNKFIWIGESQLFWYDTWLDKGRYKLLDNLMYYVGNASKYGSHFTDFLLDDASAPNALWDAEYWGRDVTREMTK